MVQALSLLHDKVGLVHRDIKPANVLSNFTQTDGNACFVGRNLFCLPCWLLGMRVRLVDFEFAYRLGDVITDDRCGTDGYVSPEWRKATPRVADPRTNQELKVRFCARFERFRPHMWFVLTCMGQTVCQADLQNGAGDVYAAGAILLELLLDVDLCGHQNGSEDLTALLDELMARPLSHEERCHLLMHNLPDLGPGRSLYVHQLHTANMLQCT
jgi:serine/threonine protein kinase